MKVQMGSCAMIYTLNFINTGSGIQKSVGGIHRRTDSVVMNKPTLFFQNKESRQQEFL
jgi:hypothetical protein